MKQHDPAKVRLRPFGAGGRLAQETVLYVLLLIPAVSEILELRAKTGDSRMVDGVETDFGLWAFRFLLVTLAVTPLRRFAHFSLTRWQRVLGLLAFTYALFHAGIYLVLEQKLDPASILRDMCENWFILFGALALLLMTPLALTSSRSAMRLLQRRWKKLHRAVYAVGCLAAVHYLLAAGVGSVSMMISVALMCVLLALRIFPAKPGKAAGSGR